MNAPLSSEQKIEALRGLLNSGEFHHATYRDRGTLWEGLWIYRKDKAFRGFFPAFSFPKDDANLDIAHNLVWHTGVSVGCFGGG